MTAVSLHLLLKLGQKCCGVWAGVARVGQVRAAEVAGGGGRIRRQLLREEVQVGLGIVAALGGIADAAVADVTPAGGDRRLLLMVLPEAIRLRGRGEQQLDEPGHRSEERKAGRGSKGHDQLEPGLHQLFWCLTRQ